MEHPELKEAKDEWDAAQEKWTEAVVVQKESDTTDSISREVPNEFQWIENFANGYRKSY